MESFYNPDDPTVIAKPKEELPNATTTLVLGILSIVFCCCCFLGFPFSIIGLVMGSKGKRLYGAGPEKYTESSFKNLNAGYICSLIGLILNILYFIASIVNYIINPDSNRQLQEILERM